MRLFWGLLPEMMRWNWFVVHDGLWIISSLICLWFYIWMFSSCEVLCYSIFLTWLIWCELSCCRSRRQTQTYLLSLILLLFFCLVFSCMSTSTRRVSHLTTKAYVCKDVLEDGRPLLIITSRNPRCTWCVFL